MTTKKIIFFFIYINLPPLFSFYPSKKMSNVRYIFFSFIFLLFIFYPCNGAADDATKSELFVAELVLIAFDEVTTSLPGVEDFFLLSKSVAVDLS
jgi:hypothetical protein